MTNDKDVEYLERLQLWKDIVGPKYPSLNDDNLLDLRNYAASDYILNGDDSELAQLFSEYLVLKALKFTK